METQFVENQYIKPSADKMADVQVFANMDCKEMLAAFAQMLKSTPIQDLRMPAESLKAAFYKRNSENVDKLRTQFTADGGKAEDFIPPKNDYEPRLKELLAQYRKERNEYTQKITAQREENLHKKQALLEKLKALVEHQGEFSVILAEFKTIQQQWQNAGAVPAEHHSELWRTYNHCVEKFYDMAKINKELRELDFKKNYELKQLLCEKAETLLLSSSAAAAFKELQKYHEQWREIGPTAPEHRKAIWERFSEASAIINKRHAEYFEKQKQERENNLAQKQSLCQQVEQFINNPPHNIRRWTELGEQVVDIQRKWKNIGVVPAKDNDAVYQRFKGACNSFFEHKKKFLQHVREECQNNIQKKTALCERAESQSQSEEWEKTTKEFIAMQNEWKTTGAVPPKLSEELWKRFKAACNAFFERKKEHFAAQEHPSLLNLKAKEALIEEMKTCTACATAQENIAAVAKFQQRWLEIGAVPKTDGERIRLAYREALQNLYKTLNISEKQKKMHEFTQQLQQNNDPQQLRIERSKLSKQVRFLEDEKRRLENNISFFGKSKNAEQYLGEFRSKIEHYAKEIELLKEKLEIVKSIKM